MKTMYGRQLKLTVEVPTGRRGSGSVAPRSRLAKPDGGLMPIAIGETLRRLTGKILARDTGEYFEFYPEPTQVSG